MEAKVIFDKDYVSHGHGLQCFLLIQYVSEELRQMSSEESARSGIVILDNKEYKFSYCGVFNDGDIVKPDNVSQEQYSRDLRTVKLLIQTAICSAH